MNVPILEPIPRLWECPSCAERHISRETQPITPLHSCKALRGITAPMVELVGAELDHSQVRHVVMDREDYVGKELVQCDWTGRPVMAVKTERADGSNDLVVLAPRIVRNFRAQGVTQ